MNTLGLFLFLDNNNDSQKSIADDSNDHASQDSTPSTTGTLGTALYDFKGEMDNELTFTTGDEILVEQPVEGAGDWSWGVFQGKRGMFPSAFVNI